MRAVRVLPVAAGLGVLAAALAVMPAQATFKGPNGLIAYQQQVGDHTQLFTAKPDGSDVHQLTTWMDSDSINASWSPDGTKLTFIRLWRKNGETVRVYVVNADGSGARELDRKLRGEPIWLPDGTHLLVMRALRFTIVDADGRHPRDAGIPGLGLASSPCILADGKGVALLVDRNGNDHMRAIFIGRLGGGRGSLKRITPWQGIADKIDCSPDGSQIVYSSPPFGPPQSSNVFTIRVDGSGVRQLTHNRGGKINNGADSWSPDGSRVAFVSNRGGQYEIYTANADGTGVRQVTHGAEAHLAAWGTHA